MSDTDAAEENPGANKRREGSSEHDQKISGAGMSITAGVAFSILIVLAWGLGSQGPLQNLRDPAFARGLITFLITLATIALALIVALQSYFGLERGAEDRYKRVREIFGIFAGVLGTVVGFYFGTTERPVQALETAAIQVESSGNSEMTLRTFITGGTAPYRYSIRFDLDAVPDIIGKVSRDGWVKESFSVKSETAEAFSPALTLEIRDKENREFITRFEPPQR